MPVALPLFEEYEKKEKCGLFGVWGTSDAAQVCYHGLFAQQHRGLGIDHVERGGVFVEA